MTSPITNESTHMVFGFAGMLLRLLREQNPQRLILVIDQAGDQGTFRSQIDPQYKANRSAPPDDFRPQVARCVELCKLLGIPVVAIPEVEADDSIATIVKRVRAAHPDWEIRIASRDKDLAQILDEKTALFDASNGAVLTAEIERLRESVAVSSRYAGEMRKREAAAIEALEKAESKIADMSDPSRPAASARKVGPVADSGRIAAAKAEVVRLMEMNKQKESEAVVELADEPVALVSQD
jgi:5'-3' exonuclease